MAPIAFLTVFVTTAAATAVVPAPAGRSPYRHVRSTQPHIERVLDLGTARSATFARLRATLEASDVIVYVQTSCHLRPDLDGQLAFLSDAHGKRYLRIDVRATLTTYELISAIGHELQHAVEVANAGAVRDQGALVTLFRRIGLDPNKVNRFETTAAREAGSRVRAELAGS